jgi:hypothetical protein
LESHSAHLLCFFLLPVPILHEQLFESKASFSEMRSFFPVRRCSNFPITDSRLKAYHEHQFFIWVFPTLVCGIPLMLPLGLDHFKAGICGFPSGSLIRISEIPL